MYINDCQDFDIVASTQFVIGLESGKENSDVCTYTQVSYILVAAHLCVCTSLYTILFVKKICYIGFIAQSFPLICPSKVLHSYLYNTSKH